MPANGNKAGSGGPMGGVAGLLVLVLDIIAIVDALKSSMETGKKALWILLIVILPVFGMALYPVRENHRF